MKAQKTLTYDISKIVLIVLGHKEVEWERERETNTERGRGRGRVVKLLCFSSCNHIFL